MGSIILDTNIFYSYGSQKRYNPPQSIIHLMELWMGSKSAFPCAPSSFPPHDEPDYTCVIITRAVALHN